MHIRALFFVAASLTACISSSETSAQNAKQKRGGTAIFSLTADPHAPNPNVSSNVPDRYVGCILYEGLIQLASDYTVLPALAKSWTLSPDGLSYAFELKKAEWHDGKPVTSEDVKYSILEVAAKYSGIFAPAGAAIESIDTPSPTQVIFKLKQPFGPFLLSLGCVQGAAILPSHLFRGTDPLTNPTTTTKPIGTGAFKLAEWKRGDYFRMVRNEKYHVPDRPFFDELIGKVIPAAETRIQALQAGEIDITQNVASSALMSLKQDPKLKVLPGDSAPSTMYSFFNVEHKPLDDKRVRHALFMAIDRDYLLRNAFFGTGEVGTAPFTPQIKWAVNPDIDYRKMYPFDASKANAILDEAGVKRDASGKRFSVKMLIYATQYPELRQVSAAMKSMWQAIGVDVSIEALDNVTYTKRLQDGNFDIAFNGYTSYSDPALGIARTFVTASINKANGNSSRYSNPVVDELFAKGERASRNEDRAVFYRQVQAILADDLPSMSIQHYIGINAMAKDLEDATGKWQGSSGSFPEGWFNR